MTDTHKKAAIGDGMFSIPKACEFSAQSRSALYAAMQANELRYYKDGKRRFVAKNDLIEWLATRLQPSD